MKSLDEFAAKWADELSGLLLAAMSEALKPNEFAPNGRFMVQQLKRARDLLDRMYYDLAGTPTVNGTLAKPNQQSTPAAKRG